MSIYNKYINKQQTRKMLVPKNLIYSQLRNSTQRLGLTSTLRLSSLLEKLPTGLKPA